MRMLTLIILLVLTGPVFAQDQSSEVGPMIDSIRQKLDLQNDQVSNITPIIEKYAMQFEQLQKSSQGGPMDSDALQTQIQGLEDQETQEVSQYLKPYQLNEWRQIQDQLFQKSAGDAETDSDEYSNLPNNPSAE